ncbi:MAG: carbohydrate ABC transporter permease [Chloroflexota bacterium]|jgi:multiple sugar transport system permease protein
MTAPAVPTNGTQTQAPPPPRRKRTARKVLNTILWYASAVIMAAFIIVPIYLIFVSATTPAEATYNYPKSLVPEGIDTDNIQAFVNASGVIDAFWRSVIAGVITVVLALGIGAPAGYAIARYVFRGRDGYRLVVLSTRAFPIVILSIPLAVTFRNLGIYDTVWGVALMHTALALPFAVLITSSVFVSIPRELEEAAQTLGCSPARAFLRVSLPLALPGLTAAAIFTWVLSWNDVFAAAVLTLREPTLPARILTSLTQASLPWQFAAAFVMLVPSLIVIFVIRKYLLGLWGRVVK